MARPNNPTFKFCACGVKLFSLKNKDVRCKPCRRVDKFMAKK